MARLEIHRFIAAPREAVWSVLAGLERQGDWMVDVRRLDITSEQKTGVGAVMDVTSELFGLPVVKDIMEVVVWEPPSRIVVAHRGRFTGTGDWRLKTAADGTLFTWIEELRPPLGPLGEAAFAVVIRPHLKRIFKRSMANVARLAVERASLSA